MTEPLSRRDAIATAYASAFMGCGGIITTLTREQIAAEAAKYADALIAELDRTAPPVKKPKPEANELVGAFGAWAIFGRGGQLLDVSCAQPIEGPRGSVLVNGRVVYEGARAILVRLVPVEE